MISKRIGAMVLAFVAALAFVGINVAVKAQADAQSGTQACARLHVTIKGSRSVSLRNPTVTLPGGYYGQQEYKVQVYVPAGYDILMTDIYDGRPVWQTATGWRALASYASGCSGVVKYVQIQVIPQ